MAYLDKRDVALKTQFGNLAPGFYRNVAKRCFDVGVVMILVLPVGFVVMVLAVALMLEGASPFYVQKRIGQNGRQFNMLKLRSMVRDADRILANFLADNPAAKAEWDEKQKLRDDPRITPLGRLIRKTSLDELPQLWNVLKGDMSLVGPRPMMPCQKDIYPGKAYYDMRPGITGLWQVSERNESSFAERAFYDNRYHDDLSLASDLSILVKTVSVVARATGQ
ncbi:sugar transferase [Cognatishimia maritima]|uniref:Sugar transferase involved in LPS biosynthesis (Colanic, teichoic acid) n=1 Tax=Cognatishimia maritima TaxID=870908 RepID=A0A1M5TUG5_9RHOB|nr:sugar transferase [Cognatishimia maritima]SHH54412.1 Sugar transferase involved in LPS biosynthesis (colanic, teichoic acid) [Cognatishimia maritima]